MSTPALDTALRSLAILPPDPLPGVLNAIRPAAAAHWARRCITEDLAAQLWREWNPEKAHAIAVRDFRLGLRDMLRNGVSLGLRVDRFQAVAAQIEPGSDARTWVKPLEDVVSQVAAGELRLHLSPAEFAEYRRDPRSWQEPLEMMFDGLFYELGVTFPPPSINADESLHGCACRCEWNDLVMPELPAPPTRRVLVNDTVDRLTLLNVKGEMALNPANGSECAFVDEVHREICEQAGLTTWDARSYAVLGISASLRTAAPAFVTRNLLELYLHRLKDVDPELVQAVESRPDRDVLLQVLRGLVAEGISIRSLPQILSWYVRQDSALTVDFSKFIVFPVGEAVFSKAPLQQAPVADLLATARGFLKRQISRKYARDNTLFVYLLDPGIEKRLAHAELSSPAEAVIVEAVKDELGSLPPTASKPVILTSLEVRSRLQMLLEPECEVVVVSYQELSPELNIQPLARITADSLEHCALLDALETWASIEVEGAAPDPGKRPLGQWLATHAKPIEDEVKATLEIRRRGLKHTARSESGLKKLLGEVIAGCTEFEAQDPRRLQRLGAWLAATARSNALEPGAFLQVLFMLGAGARRHLALELETSEDPDAFKQFGSRLELLESALQAAARGLAEAVGLR
ncbi:MAG TPA: FHIPEP family type III secretion protein [Povalibacter sp.]|nr:FHIPEP family type III secretion protein [Povalibacter sp.]